MQVSNDTNASLLDYINSQGNTGSLGSTKKQQGIGALLQQSCVAANPVLTRISNEAAKSGVYKNAVTHSSAVLNYLEALSENKEGSLFAKAEESENTDEVITKIGSMAISYNKMIDSLKEEGGKTNQAYLKSLYCALSESNESLEKIGLSVKADGSIATDYEALCDADRSDLKAAFGSGSKLTEALQDTIINVKEDSTKSSRLAQIYSTAYSNSGSYSQYHYIENLYDSLA